MLPCICGAMHGVTPPYCACVYTGMGIAQSELKPTLINCMIWIVAHYALSVVILLELLPIAAAMMNMLFVFSRGETKARIFFVLCNGLWLVYYIIIGSSTLLGAAFSVASGLFALIKHRGSKSAG